MRNINKVLIALSIASFITACPSPSENNTNPIQSASPSSSNAPTTEPSTNNNTIIVPVSTPAPTSLPVAVVNYNPSLESLPKLIDGYRLSVNGSVFNGAGNKISNERLESSSTAKGYMRLTSMGFEKVGNSELEYDFRMTIKPSNNFSLPQTFSEFDFATAELELNMYNKKTNQMYNFTSSSLTGRDKEIPSDSMNNSGAVGKKSTVIFTTNSDKNRYSGYIDTVVSSKDSNSPIQNIKARLEFNYLLAEKINR
jgi:hypothetical protein